MKSGQTVKRILFTSSPLVLGLLAGLAGCSSGTGDTTGIPTAPIKPIPPTFTSEPNDDPKVDLPGFKGSASCQKCHTTIYDEWKDSMHKHGLDSPVMISETNQVFAADLIMRDAPDPQWFCTNCHGPISTLYGQDGRLPFRSLQPDRVTDEALTEGVGCIACHSYAGNPQDSRGSISDFQDDFIPGTTYFGPISDPATSPFHQATTTPLYESGVENICLNCHNVKNDRNGDGRFDLGVDLFLQTTFDEYNLDYRVNGGESTCLDCHMAEKDTPEPAAPGFPNSPFRKVHDHKFVGVDFELTDAAQGIDPQAEFRRQLLADPLSDNQGAASNLALQNVVFDGINLSFDALITNQNSGHNLPTGFAFTRQMFLEVVVRDNDSRRLAQSGELQDPGNDLCDDDTLKDILGPFVQGCANNVPDPQLVNFQQKLVDFVALDNGVLIQDPVKGHEQVLQFQTGGAVARTRPIDGQLLTTIRPFETRTFNYKFVLPAQSEPIKLSVVLKFRNLPPYFLRVLANREANIPGGLKGLVSSKSFKFITMASQFQSINPQ